MNAVKGKQSAIHLVVCTDDAFVAHTAALLHSVKLHASMPVVAHVFARLSDDNQRKIVTLSDAGFTIDVVSALPDYSDLPISERFRARLSQAAFWRLAIADILSDLHKALYLDSDMIAVGDIAPLWEHDVSDVAAVVVKDSLLSPQKPWRELGKQDPRYFNSGMMLMNLERWRERGLMDRTVRLVRDNPSWPYNDQHALNVALDGDTRFAEGGWNVQTQCLLYDENIVTKLVHFTGFEKPWHQTSAHPYTETYRTHRNATPFATAHYPLVMDADDEKIIAALKEKVPEGGNIGIWGAGMRGRRLMTYITQTSPEYQVTTLIDRAVKGEYLGVPIDAALSAKSRLKALVIATLPHRDAIISELSAGGRHPVTIV